MSLCLPLHGAVASGILLWAAVPLAPGWAAPVPSGYESFGLAPDDFTTDPVTFHPRLLAKDKDSETWPTRDERGASSPPDAAGASDETKPITGNHTTARWIGILGFVLLLLRRSHRHR